MPLDDELVSWPILAKAVRADANSRNELKDMGDDVVSFILNHNFQEREELPLMIRADLSNLCFFSCIDVKADASIFSKTLTKAQAGDVIVLRSNAFLNSTKPNDWIEAECKGIKGWINRRIKPGEESSKLRGVNETTDFFGLLSPVEGKTVASAVFSDRFKSLPGNETIESKFRLTAMYSKNQVLQLSEEAILPANGAIICRNVLEDPEDPTSYVIRGTWTIGMVTDFLGVVVRTSGYVNQKWRQLVDGITFCFRAADGALKMLLPPVSEDSMQLLDEERGEAYLGCSISTGGTVSTWWIGVF